ncbi:MAG: FtsX-like permease family protein [Chloroflexales bacterium]|nr:FtsX-like permease family protein [Chloroflexales bacterium]
MLAPRWRKVLGDLWSNKTRTALVVFSIALGVFAIGLATGSREILVRDLNNAWNATNPSSATIGADNIDDALVETVRRMPGIEDAQASRSILVRARNAAGEWKDLLLYSYRDFDDIRAYKPTPNSGQWPPARKAVVLERTTLSWLGIPEGGKLVVEMSDGKQYSLDVTGTVYNNGTPPTKLMGLGTGYISLDTVEILGLPREFNTLHIVVAEHKLDEDHIRTIANQVEEKIEKSGRTSHGISIEKPGVYPGDAPVQGFIFLLTVMGAFALLLSGFLVVNTISALLTQQIKQIGVMKSIGARSIDIAQLYLTTVLAFGILSLLIGIPLGVLGAWGLAAFFADLLNFEITTVAPSLNVVGLQIVAGLLVPMLAALVPIFNGTRVSVREAISGYGLGKGRFGRSWIDRLLEKIRFLSRPLLLSLRNTFRRKGRLMLTLSTLILSGVIFMAVLSERTTLRSTIIDFLSVYNFDVEVDLNRPYRIAMLDQQVRVPGVTAVEYWSTYSGRLLLADDSESNKKFGIRSVQADGATFRPEVSAGRWLLPEDDGAVVVNSRYVIDYPETRLGDLLRIKVEGKELSLRVVGVANMSMASAGMYVNRLTFDPLVGNAGKATVVGLVTERRETALQNQVAEQAKAVLKHQGVEVFYTETETQRVASYTLSTDIIIYFLMLMAGLLAVVGGLGLMGTMSINVLERTREIGVLRAIGAGDWAILRLVLVEGVLIGVLSWVIGAMLALPVGLLMNKGIEFAFDAEGIYSFVVSYEGVALWLAIVVCLASLASFLPARSASRMTIRDVLSYE